MNKKQLLLQAQQSKFRLKEMTQIYYDEFIKEYHMIDIPKLEINIKKPSCDSVSMKICTPEGLKIRNIIADVECCRDIPWTKRGEQLVKNIHQLKKDLS